MKLRSGTHHPAENLKTLARKELMRREVACQPPVNLFVTQFLGMLIQPQWFSFDSAYLILQYLVGTKLDAHRIIFGCICRPIAWWDRHVVDGFFNFLAWSAEATSDEIRGLQSGRIQQYTFVFLLGTLALILLLLL